MLRTVVTYCCCVTSLAQHHCSYVLWLHTDLCMHACYYMHAAMTLTCHVILSLLSPIAQAYALLRCVARNNPFASVNWSYQGSHHVCDIVGLRSSLLPPETTPGWVRQPRRQPRLRQPAGASEEATVSRAAPHEGSRLEGSDAATPTMCEPCGT